MDCNATMLIGGSLISLFVGFLTGIFGVGGGFLAAPALIIILGVPAPVAVGTDVAMILANSSLGVLKRYGTGTVDVKLAFTISVGSIVGVLFGVKLLEMLKNMPPLVIMGEEQPAVQYIVLWVFLVLLAGISFFLAFDYKYTGGISPKKRVGWFSRLPIPPYGHFSSLEERKLPLIALVLLGLCIGTLTGFIGIGGGVILLPGLIYLVGQRSVKAAGTSLLLVWIASLVAVIGHTKNGNVHLTLWIAMVVGGLIGTNFGTQIGLKIAGPKLRLYFVYVVAAAVLMVAYKIYMMTFDSGAVCH